MSNYFNLKEQSGKTEEKVSKLKKLNFKKNKKFIFVVFLLLLLPIPIIYSQQKQNIVNFASEENPEIKNQEDDYTLNYPLDKKDPISSLEVSGKTILKGNNSFVRVVLVDKNMNEYLVYEAYPLLIGGFSEQVKDTCDETCFLSRVQPDHLRVEGNNSSFEITNTSTEGIYVRRRGVNSIESESRSSVAISQSIKQDKDIEKINRLKLNISKKGGGWIVGETRVSRLTYSQKKRLFIKKTDHLPNLQGFEFYKGGIFEAGIPSQSISTLDPSSLSESQSVPQGGYSSYPGKWDYREFHGSNWNTSVKNQEGCGSCWAFSTAATIEGVTNLFYNQHIDLDLSEQDILSCSGAGSCGGGWPDQAMEYVSREGVSSEACFSYSATDKLCSNKCVNWQESLTNIAGTSTNRASDYKEEKEYENIIKRNLIEKGMLSAWIYDWGHVMSLEGWQNDPVDGKSVWVFKNSWGEDWGDKGYARVKASSFWVSQIYSAIPPNTVANKKDLSVACTDTDNDNYCFWGLGSEKPSTCSVSCRPEKDCNDVDSNALGFDENYNCTFVSIPPKDEESPTTPVAGHLNNYYIPQSSTYPEMRWVEFSWIESTDNEEVFGYEVYRDGQKVGVATQNYYFDDTNLIPGSTISYSVRAYDSSGNFSDFSETKNTTILPSESPTPTPTNIPLPSISKNKIILNPSADSYVKSDQKSANFGTSALLNTSSNPSSITFIKFNLSSLGNKTVTNAKLLVKVNKSSKSTHSLKKADGKTWSEKKINFSNKPSLIKNIKSFKPTTAGKYIEIDVTSIVNQEKGGDLTFGITSSGNSISKFYSRESVSTHKPKLIIEY